MQMDSTKIQYSDPLRLPIPGDSAAQQSRQNGLQRDRKEMNDKPTDALSERARNANRDWHWRTAFQTFLGLLAMVALALAAQWWRGRDRPMPSAPVGDAIRASW